MKARPSGRTTIPLQNMSQPTGCVVTVPVRGSNTPACKFVLLGRLPDPETTSPVPLCRSAACTGLIGMRFGSVCHCPCTFACAYSRVGKPAKQAAAANRSRKCRVTFHETRQGEAGRERGTRQPPGQEALASIGDYVGITPGTTTPVLCLL